MLGIGIGIGIGTWYFQNYTIILSIILETHKKVVSVIYAMILHDT